MSSQKDKPPYSGIIYGEIMDVLALEKPGHSIIIQLNMSNVMQINLKKEKLAKMLASNQNRDFWKEIKKIRGCNKHLPSAIDSISDSDDIVSLFAGKFSALYNSVPCDEELMHNVSESVNDVCICNKSDVNHLHNINVKQVMKAVNEMKSNKKDGTNMLISENIIHGTHKLYVLLSLLFTCMIIHTCYYSSSIHVIIFIMLLYGYCPVGMITGTMIPIPKIKGTVNFDQFRAITLSSLLGKMFDMILLEYFKNELLSSQLQFGFKQNSSTAMCSYLVQEVISHYESSGNSVFCIMLDASKAFDRLQFCKLFNELRQKLICPLIIRVLIFMYTNQLLSVKWNDKLSKSFKVLNGVKQGGVLSPVLFCLYLDVLLNKLYHTGVGCYLGPYFCGALAYADDVILLSPTLSGAKSMLNVCAKFSSDYNVKFNASKSNVIIFGKSHIHRKHFKLNSVELPEVNNAKHLGHMISNLCSGYIDINTIIQSFNKSVNILIAEFGFLQSSLLFQLFLNYCCSLYGVVLCNIYTKSTENLKVAWRKAIRRIYKISPRTHNNFCHCYVIIGTLK